jgi:hypothetical protein
MSGFVYIWYDRKHKRFYIGSHWGREDDGYICSSSWMKKAYAKRPEDFKRRILARVASSYQDLLNEEIRWQSMIKPEEFAVRNGKDTTKVRYYNFRVHGAHWTTDSIKTKTVGERISVIKRLRSQERRLETGDPLTPAQRAHVTTVNVGRTHTEEWKEESSKRLKDQWDSGVRSRERSEETRKKISESKKGRWSEAQQAAVERNAAIVADKISKDWKVTSPSGEEFLVRNLKKFCLERGLANTNITKPSGSKGWHAERTRNS